MRRDDHGVYTITKYGATQKLQNTLLDDVVGRSLRLRWSDDAAHDETVKRFLYECHERGRWIQCNCVIDPTSHARPLLAVRRTESTITLARMTGPDRVRHAATCVFDQGSLDIGTGDGDDVPVNEALWLSRATRAREIAQGSLSVPIKPPTFYLGPAALRLAARQTEPQPPAELSAPGRATASGGAVSPASRVLRPRGWVDFQRTAHGVRSIASADQASHPMTKPGKGIGINTDSFLTDSAKPISDALFCRRDRRPPVHHKSINCGSNHPPGKPGAFNSVSRSKRLNGIAHAAPTFSVTFR